MAYKFKYLADVDSAESLSDEANIIIEEHGDIKKIQKKLLGTNEVSKESLVEEIEKYLTENPPDGSVTVDSELSETSENPVQNKVLAKKIEAISLRSTEAINKAAEASNKVTELSGQKLDKPATAEVGQMIVVKAVGEDGKPTEVEAVNVPQGGTGGTGLTTSEKALMLSLFKATVYNNPEMQTTVNALEQKWALSGGDDSGDDTGGSGGDDSGNTGEEETVYYTITNNLTNVSSSNSTGAVEKDASYNATLTVNNGYEMESVTVTMGGSDITATAYVNGVVTIGKVTGNVVITANATATQEARTVYFASDDSITKTQGAMNKTGTMALTSNVRYKVATLPYSEGMKIHTYMMGSSINDYPPFILYDGNTYTIPEYETPVANTYEITLSGLSNPTVYVNMLGTNAGVFDDAKFYYVTQ